MPARVAAPDTPPAEVAVSAPSTEQRAALRTALKRTAGALQSAEIPFALAGSYALWVHGAAEPDHDADFVVTEDAVEDAAQALAAAGFSVTRPPEGWLFKAEADGVVIDLLHRLAGDVVDEGFLARAPVVEVLAVQMPVLTPTDVLSGQLRAMREHYCDFGAVLPGVRSVREQVDWPRLRAETADSPFARAFLLLCDLLGLTDRRPGGGGRPVAPTPATTAKPATCQPVQVSARADSRSVAPVVQTSSTSTARTGPGGRRATTAPARLVARSDRESCAWSATGRASTQRVGGRQTGRAGGSLPEATDVVASRVGAPTPGWWRPGPARAALSAATHRGRRRRRGRRPARAPPRRAPRPAPRRGRAGRAPCRRRPPRGRPRSTARRRPAAALPSSSAGARHRGRTCTAAPRTDRSRRTRPAGPGRAAPGRLAAARPGRPPGRRRTRSTACGPSGAATSAGHEVVDGGRTCGWRSAAARSRHSVTAGRTGSSLAPTPRPSRRAAPRCCGVAARAGRRPARPGTPRARP